MHTQSKTLVDTAELNRDFIRCKLLWRYKNSSPTRVELALMTNPGIELRPQKGQVLGVKYISEKQGES